MKVLLKIILGSLFIVFIQSCSEDTINENGKGTLTGTVVKKGDNSPLEDVKITTNPASSTVFSNEDGEFIIEDVPTGQYSVQASKDEFLDSFEAATISDGITVNVVFELDISTANNRPPEEPTLLFPADNATDVDLAVAFLWTSTDPDDDPIEYNLEIRNSTNEEVLLFENLEDTIYNIEDLRLGETYFWQVTATDNINEPVLSSFSSFTTLAESSNRFYYVRKEGDNNVIYSGSDQGEDANHNEFQLTSIDKNSFRPRKNNAANKIAYLRTDGTETHLFTMNTDGTEINKLTNAIPVSGFRQDEIDFTWYQNGQRLYYPNLNKIYSVNSLGTGNNLVYEAPQGIFVSEIATNEFNDLVLIKTNDADGYQARIVVINTEGVEQTVVIEGEPGALGGIDFSIDGTKVLYTRDVSGFENNPYRQLDSRIFEYDIVEDITLEIDTDKVEGTNDLDCKYSPDNGSIIFMNTSNDGVSQKKIYKYIIDESEETNKELIFTDASMPDWQ